MLLVCVFLYLGKTSTEGSDRDWSEITVEINQVRDGS